MKNIIIIGFMGSGKTTIGRLLSKKYNMEFIDIDEKIEQTENMSISNIFDLKGEKYFRRKESSILKKNINERNVVISTGGGIIEEESNMELLKKNKNVIWLDANTDTILNNISNEIDKRPKLKSEENLKLAISKLLKERYSKYKEASNIYINTNNKNIDEVISDILVYID
ncbi:MAG: shikimate kinase [Paraclostridium sp.]